MSLRILLILITLTQLILHLKFVSSSKGLEGINLKMAAYHGPPYMSLIRQPDGNYTLTGSGVNIWEWLSKKLNFTMTAIVVEEALIAKLGIYEAAIYKIIYEEVDGMLGSLIVTPERKEKMDFTFMSWTEPYTLIVPKPQEKRRLFAFIRPFQPLVWLSLAIAVSMFVGITSWFSWFAYNHMSESEPRRIVNEIHTKCVKTSCRERKLKHIITHLGYYTIYVVNIFTNHGIYTPYAQHSFRILAGSLLLAALVLVNSYSIIVVSSLTVPVMEPAINSFEDLASSKRVSLVLRKDIIIGQLILNAKTGVFKILGDQIRQNSDQLFLSNAELNQRLEQGSYAYPFLASANRDYIGKQFKKEGFCRFQLSDPLQISSGFFCMLLSKNFKYTQQLSFSLMELWETGLTRYWIANLTRQGGERCLIKKEKSTSAHVRQVPIKKEDLISAFLILGFGTGLSFIIFLIESFIGKRLTRT